MSNFYIWQASDDFAIHLSLKVVTQLAAQLGSTEELWGILLGRTIETPSRATVIEDFVVIPPDGSAAAAADPPGNDQIPFGFFRFQRDGTLHLEPGDLQTFNRLFHENGTVALRIQTNRRGDVEAALFYWQDGGVHPSDFGVGFPLDAALLTSGHPGWRYAGPLKKPRRWKSMQGPQVSAPVSSGTGEIRWSRLWPTIVLAIACVVALQFACNCKWTAAAAPQAVLASTEPAVNDSGLGLTVTSRQHQLEIRWNRESAAIMDSATGVMKITEAGITESVPFEQRQLRDGYVAYSPKTNIVAITLEVTAKDGTTKSESIQSVAIP